MTGFWFAFQNFCQNQESKDCLYSNFLDSFLAYAQGSSPIARCMPSSTVDAAKWAETQYLTMPTLFAIVTPRLEAHHCRVRSNLSC